MVPTTTPPPCASVFALEDAKSNEEICACSGASSSLFIPRPCTGIFISSFPIPDLYRTDSNSSILYGRSGGRSGYYASKRRQSSRVLARSASKQPRTHRRRHHAYASPSARTCNSVNSLPSPSRVTWLKYTGIVSTTLRAMKKHQGRNPRRRWSSVAAPTRHAARATSNGTRASAMTT